MLNMVADPDADGRISRAELMAAPYRVFDRLDANDDGAISAAEIEAARARAG
jgi:Ca2+-binding EF-hand superfamily protein